MNDKELANFVMQRHARLESDRAPWNTFWQDSANYVMPRRAEILTRAIGPDISGQELLFDATAVQANMILANGQLAWMTPAEARWFSYDPPQQLRGIDPVDQWFRACSEIASLELAKSNFYAEIHELYLDRGCFGTAVISCEGGNVEALNFRKFDVGTFSIAENDEGYVDTLSREIELTTRQAVQWFGKDNVSDNLRKEFEDEKQAKKEQLHCFIHQCFPRAADEIDLGRRDGANKAIASVYLEKEARKVVKVSGYDEQPFFATRYLKWIASQPYGWSPAWIAIPEARQLNFLEKQLDALAELTAFPRFLLPAGYEGEVDFRASGVTYFDPANPNAIPKEWGTVGRYDVGFERSERKRKAINDAFHVDLFRMFSDLQKQMTAREVMERSAEKLIQFSPTFARMTTELFNPLLRRVFAILIRKGVFPPPPREVIQQDPVGNGFIPVPEVSYSSRIALAIKNLENASFGRVFEMWEPIIQQRPDLLDNFDLDRMLRDTSRNAGLPARWLTEVAQIAQIRAARQQEIDQQKQMMRAQQIAEALGKVGKIGPDSLIGQGVQRLLPQAGQAPGQSPLTLPSQ